METWRWLRFWPAETTLVHAIRDTVSKDNEDGSLGVTHIACPLAFRSVCAPHTCAPTYTCISYAYKVLFSYKYIFCVFELIFGLLLEWKTHFKTCPLSFKTPCLFLLVDQHVTLPFYTQEIGESRFYCLQYSSVSDLTLSKWELSVKKKTHGLSSEAALQWLSVFMVCVHVCAFMCMRVCVHVHVCCMDVGNPWIQLHQSLAMWSDCVSASLKLKIAWITGYKFFPWQHPASS